MVTIKLQVSEKILDKILWFLKQFSSEDIQILDSESEFTMSAHELDQSYKEVVTDNATTISLNEFNSRLTEKIAKHGS